MASKRWLTIVAGALAIGITGAPLRAQYLNQAPQQTTPPRQEAKAGTYNGPISGSVVPPPHDGGNVVATPGAPSPAVTSNQAGAALPPNATAPGNALPSPESAWISPGETQYVPYPPYAPTVPAKPGPQSVNLPDLAGAYAGSLQRVQTLAMRRDQMRNQWAAAVRNVRLDLATSQEIQNAQRDAVQARTRYMQRRDQAIRQLQQNPQYRQDRQRLQQIQQRLALYQSMPSPDRSVIDQLAMEELPLMERVDTMEARAMAGASDLTSLRQNWAAAEQNLNETLSSARQRLQTDPQVRQARDALDNVEQQYQVALDDLATSRAGYAQALREEAISNARNRIYSPYAFPYWLYGYPYPGTP